MARIVFDLDGTLIDSAKEIQFIANSLLQERALPPLSLPETISFIGNGAGVLLQKMSALRGIPEAEHADLLESFEARYSKPNNLTEIYPNVREVLEQLRAAGHRLGICTNKPIVPTQVALDHLDLGKLFDHVLGGNSLPQRKPHPAPLLAVFEALGEGPMIYVGDSDVDAETAARADVPFLLFTEGYCKVPHGELPHAALFSDFAELPTLVTQLTKA